MRTPTAADLAALQRWPMRQDPFAAVKDFLPSKLILRWFKPSHLTAHLGYWRRRAEWVRGRNFERYFAETDRTIAPEKWEYLKLRKSWYQIPLNWGRFAGEDCSRLLDLGCGDGDLTQRVADFIAATWQRTGRGHTLEIIGVDLAPSRIQNARRHAHSPDPRITMAFEVADATKPLPYPDRYFDYSINTGVLEILEDEPARRFCAELCRVTAWAIYTEDLADRYPGGYPREDLTPLFRPHGFEITDRRAILTEPFALFRNPDPCRLWPILKDQVVWLERVGVR